MARRTEIEADRFEDGPSKTQIKQAMHDLQALGVALLDLPVHQLEEIEMEEKLLEAFRELRRLRAHSARKRQTQYIGKLLDQTDVEPFRRAIAAHHMGKTLDARRLHEAEGWRDRLIASDEELTGWIKLHPAASTQAFRALIRNARREVAAAGAEQSKGRAYRELFQEIRKLLESAAVRDKLSGL